MPPLTLVLLPGLDGTGQQFAPLLRELPSDIAPVVVSYPVDRALGYDALLPLVRAQLPSDRPFLLLAESFSGPLAIRLAAQQPARLRALVLVATFHRQPVGPWLAVARPMLRGFAFALPPPAFAVRRFLAGADASDEFVAEFQATAASVRGSVLAARARAALDVDVSAALTEVTVPIAYFAGLEDVLICREMLVELCVFVFAMMVYDFACAHLVLQRRPRESAAVIAELAARFAQ